MGFTRSSPNFAYLLTLLLAHRVVEPREYLRLHAAHELAHAVFAPLRTLLHAVLALVHALRAAVFEHAADEKRKGEGNTHYSVTGGGVSRWWSRGEGLG